jgi:NAD+ synthase
MKREVDYQKIQENIINGIKNYVSKSGCKKVVVGISGGADSALTTLLCVKALEKENVIGVLMPYGKQKDIKDSKKLANDLKISHRIINVKKIVDSCIKSVNSTNKLVKANIMARSRMMILYAIANEVGGLVAGTTNKSELAIGYGTKYGDLACDFEVIIELYKTEVWNLLRGLAKDNKLQILKKIAEKKPTAGLWNGQTDEGEFGFSYETLDNYLQNKKIDKRIEIKIKKLIEKSEHKRQMPPGIKIG